MVKKRARLNSKQFFTISVLSVMAFSLIVFTMAVQKPTNTQSEATGNNTGSIINCNLKNNRAGGIEVYDQETGEKRVMCINLFKPYETSGISYKNDNNLGAFNASSDIYSDIWEFNDRVDSFKLRSNPWCIVQVSIFRDPNLSYLLKEYYVGAMTVGNQTVQNFDLASWHKNKATSIRLKASCDPAKY